MIIAVRSLVDMLVPDSRAWRLSPGCHTREKDMDNFEMLQGWVEAMGRVMGARLELDENRVCTMTLSGENICVSLTPSESDEGAFVIAGPVVPLTMDPSVDVRLLKAALKLNFLGSETGSGILGLGLYDGMLLLAHRVRYGECDEVLLLNVVMNVANDIERLRGRVLEGVREAPGSPLPSPGVFA